LYVTKHASLCVSMTATTSDDSDCSAVCTFPCPCIIHSRAQSNFICTPCHGYCSPCLFPLFRAINIFLVRTRYSGPDISETKLADALSHLTFSPKCPRSPALQPRSTPPAHTFMLFQNREFTLLVPDTPDASYLASISPASSVSLQMPSNAHRHGSTLVKTAKVVVWNHWDHDNDVYTKH
jgi:hypothetical protein